MKTFRKLWKKFWEPILKSAFGQWIIVSIMAVLIWVVYFTCKKSVQGEKNIKDFKNKSAVFIFWHGRTMMLSTFVRMYGMRGYAVASRHKDGRMMAKLLRLFGLKSILGSSTKGGVSVLRQGVKILRAGKYVICMSPDGPSGPSLRLKDGAMYFAKMANVPLIPVSFSCTKPWFQNRWDRYLIAKPFSKIKFVVGKPIYIKSKTTEAEFENIRAEIEDILVKQTRKVDKEFTKFVVEQDLTAVKFKEVRRRAKRIKKLKK